MARTPGIALAGVLLLVAACGAERGEDDAVVLGTAPAAPSPDATVPTEPTVAASATASPTTTASPAPSATPDAVPPPPVATDLEARFPAASALIEDAPARVGVAVLTPDAALHVGGDEDTFALASVVKLPIMLATLERARIEERALTSQERRLLELMITVSSNNATDELWSSLGEGPGVAALLEPLGVVSIDFAPDDQWGDSRASALDVAALLGLLVDDQSVMAADLRVSALELMQGVVADQRWGASAGVDLGLGSDATLAIKNGWYPESSGWLLNSAGIITVSTASELSAAHVVVILTEGAADQTEGVRSIEEIAAAINHELVSPALAVRPNSPTFAASTTPDTPDAEEPEPEPEVAETPEPVPTPPPVSLVAFSQSSDVLVPVGSLVGSDGTSSKLTLWYELPTSVAEEMMASYATSMAQLGWLQVTGPPSVVLSKSSEDRWVGITAHPATPGARLIEVTIAPAPGVVPAGAR